MKWEKEMAEERKNQQKNETTGGRDTRQEGSVVRESSNQERN